MSNLIANEIERNIPEDYIIRDIRSLFRLKKKKDNSDVDKIVRGIRWKIEKIRRRMENSINNSN